MRAKSNRGITQQLVEDCFNVVKRKCDQKSNNVATSAFCHSHLIDDRVLANKYRFEEIEWSADVAPRSSVIDAAVNTPVFAKSKLEPRLRAAGLSDIAGYGDASWFSPGAAG